mgnify:CR=1 FL=1
MDKPLSRNAQVSMYKRDAVEAAYDEEAKKSALALTQAYDTAVKDAEEKTDFKTKMSSLWTKISTFTKVKSSELYDNFKNKAHDVSTRLSVAYAAYQSYTLRETQAKRDAKLAKYDAFLEKFGFSVPGSDKQVKSVEIEDAAMDVTSIETVSDAEVIVDDIVDDKASIIEGKDVIDAPVTAVALLEDKQSEVEPETDVASEDVVEEKIDAAPSAKSSMEEKRARIEEAYKTGMANVISALRDYLNDFDEKSASVEDLEAVSSEIEKAGNALSNLKKTTATIRELPSVEYESESEVDSYGKNM